MSDIILKLPTPIEAIESPQHENGSESVSLITASDVIDVFLLEMYIRDSNNNAMLDSSYNRIQSDIVEK